MGDPHPVAGVTGAGLDEDTIRRVLRDNAIEALGERAWTDGRG
jgi:hypothetical protein